MRAEPGMRIVSVNVGQPRQLIVGEHTVITGIYKNPVAGRIAVRRHNLAGDGQADLRVHGGAEKAVYAYPTEHYPYWQAQYPDLVLPWGMFGENLTITGLLEADVHIGDCLQVGSAQLMVTQPRIPCYKLGIRFGREDIVKRFLASGLSGFYFSVVEEGEVAAGDPITLLSRDPQEVSVTEITRLYSRDRNDVEGLKRVLAVPALPDNWRDYFSKRLARIEAGE